MNFIEKTDCKLSVKVVAVSMPSALTKKLLTLDISADSSLCSWLISNLL